MIASSIREDIYLRLLGIGRGHHRVHVEDLIAWLDVLCPCPYPGCHAAWLQLGNAGDAIAQWHEIRSRSWLSICYPWGAWAGLGEVAP